jgi:hypothetical protein
MKQKQLLFKDVRAEYEKLQEMKAEILDSLLVYDNVEAVNNYLSLNAFEKKLFLSTNIKDELRYSNNPIVIDLVGPPPPYKNKSCGSCVTATLTYDIKFEEKWNTIIDKLNLEPVLLLSKKHRDYIIMNLKTIQTIVDKLAPIFERLDVLTTMFNEWYTRKMNEKGRITKTELEFLNRWFKFE